MERLPEHHSNGAEQAYPGAAQAYPGAEQAYPGAEQAYPRPQLRRDQWVSLDGQWDFAIDAQAELMGPVQVVWNASITVPFAPETAMSGVGDTSFYCVAWYRRHFDRPAMKPKERLVLHFGAVDYAATVWVNGVEVYWHQGGYTPFSVDITRSLVEHGWQEIVVRAEDDPADLEKPRGKQDWKLESHSIWYPRTTGIWQSVWMEVVPAVRIRSLRWTSSLERWEIGLEAHVHGVLPEGASLAVEMRTCDQVLVKDRYTFVNGTLGAGSRAAGQLHRRIALSDPGIDDFRNDLLWSPDKPTLIDVDLQLLDGQGQVLDAVKSYTALRSLAVQGDRFILNGRPWPLRLVLDQGYWETSGQTAPNDDAFMRDILLVKAMGFNGVRMHQKIEDPKFLYWADHLGLLVWEEMPSAYRYTQRSVERLTREWMEVLKRDWSHPCIVSWVPFNESWGVPDLPESAAQRHYIQALYHLTKTIDPTRPVIGNDGWESVATDIIGIHDYDDRPDRIARRYGIEEIEGRLFQFERPGGRMLRLGKDEENQQPIVLTEFGGIALRQESNHHLWGYSMCRTPEELLARYTALLDVVRQLPALAGFCYTQFTDTFQEANGLVYANRTPKIPLDKVAMATSGSTPDENDPSILYWRKRLMEMQR
jgi:beta-galactosidase/beta-glucuronidase